MAYWVNKSQSSMAGDSFSLGSGKTVSGGSGEFYELEPAIVLDVILDKDHPFLKNAANLQIAIDADRWPADLQNKKPLQDDIDYSWIGRALVRMQFSTPTVQKEKLIWAFPMDASLSEYPLVNEVVMLFQYRNKYFYTNKLNSRNLPNEGVDFSANRSISGTDNTELYSTSPYSGVQSKTSFDGTVGYKGVAGKYYKINNRMRRVQRFEGDLVIESRFGQSIKFGAYDTNRENDKGDTNNTEYADNGGNPMIVIRNRQRKLLKVGEKLQLRSSPNLATVLGTSVEKNAGGYIPADINHDGSTLAITTGQTISRWVTTCYKKMFGTTEEVSAFNGTTSFKYPELNGDQVIINSDRLIFSSRYGETFHYAKKRYAIVTDSEYTVDAHDQIVFTTHNKTVINSPAIYLGEYDMTKEPVLLGQTSIEWLYDLCNWLLEHTHWYKHSHVDAGSESPSQTQLPVQVQKLIALRNKLHTLLSRRVFVTGGGYAPGQDGAKI